MSVPDVIKSLVDRFHRNRDTYSLQSYNEMQVRNEFINPFFIALGWDVNNAEGLAEAYKDVIHEDSLKIGDSTKAPDYCFRIGGQRKFFLEAKKPFVDIKSSIHPAFQLRRYAWSAKLPLSILTDFEEFSVYDCRVKPSKNDAASNARIKYIKYTDYEDKWDEIEEIFHRQSILMGYFDRFVESTRKKRGTAEVDDAFLEEMDRWREILAKHIALRNRGLTERDLNHAVQVTIDRIIFLRICEDRGVEPYGQLNKILDGKNLYSRLVDIYKKADERYNSGLFHFKKETGRPEPDSLTPNLILDDTILKNLLKELYYPDSPYEFSVIPADILGHVYERFLGKVIRLTKGGRAKIEEKPEVRKAGGVYYTPTYIVDYIVDNTLGKMLEKKTPRSAAKLCILDPACGSGSFLLGAYQCLLDWHLKYYEKHNPGKLAKKKTPPIYQASGGDYKLTTSERKKILLNNIYGVDIDSQAVEVTKLTLLLKVLEDESSENINAHLRLFHERALPDLGNNIKCGNSLIGPDFYDSAQMTFLDEEERYRINVFDWKTEFPEIFSGKNPGFDAVIGNPPYIRIQGLKEWAPQEVEFFKKVYKAGSKGNFDIYVLFIERGLQLVNNEGQLGFILPHKFFNSQYGEPLRALLAKGNHLSHVVHFGHQQVFTDATTYTCLLFLNKAGSKFCQIMRVADLQSWRTDGDASHGEFPAKRITSSEWNFIVGKGAALFEKLAQMPIKLDNIANIFVGVQTNADDIYIVDEVKREKNRILCYSKATSKQHWFETQHVKPLLKGSVNIRRYYLSDLTKYLIFPYDISTGKSNLISSSAYQDKFPLTWSYLQENKLLLSRRNKGRMGHEWYGYVYKKNHTRFGSPKLVVPSIAIGACFAPDLEGRYYFVGSGGGGGGGYGIEIRDKISESMAYLLGLLNSKLSSIFLKEISTPFRGGYIALNRQYICRLPIRTIDFSDPEDKSRHDRMVDLVEHMLDLHKRLNDAKIPHDKETLQRQITATDQQIDRLVYELYDLTEEEIRIVEGESV